MAVKGLSEKHPKPVSRQRTIASVAFVSLGCPKNLVDSEKMLGLLAEDGVALTGDHAAADAIVINTCGFLEASKTEALEMIREAIGLKNKANKSGREKRVVVAGCLVQRHKETLLAEAPGIDALVGVFDRANIVRAVRGDSFEPMQEGGDLGTFHPVSTFIGKHDRTKAGYTESDRARLRLTPRHYAYLRVSEGCNQGCAFCTIPSIRGRMRSKPPADILDEARELIDDGAHEINLIGQDTTSYGQDIGYDGPGEGLSGLLRSISAVPGLGWARLMYAYPSTFSDDMIRALADSPKMLKYIDMPLQHIDDEILRAMRRKVTRAQIETLLDKLRKWVPGIALRTTFISGFPGETDRQHAELLAFIRDFQFDCLGVFEYSPEANTPAGRLHAENAVPSAVAAQRKREIMLAQRDIVEDRNATFVGREMTVLIDEVDRTNKSAIGRHAGQAPEIDGAVILENHAANAGDVVTARIYAWVGYDLVGRVVSAKGQNRPRARRPLSLPVVAGG